MLHFAPEVPHDCSGHGDERMRSAAERARVGRAHIPVRMLGPATGAIGDEARELRGPGLPRTAWHLLRGGIDGVVCVQIDDDRDPVREWVFSTRTPDRVIAAIRRAQRA